MCMCLLQGIYYLLCSFIVLVCKLFIYVVIEGCKMFMRGSTVDCVRSALNERIGGKEVPVLSKFSQDKV
jgi:hypothetical protein